MTPLRIRWTIPLKNKVKNIVLLALFDHVTSVLCLAAPGAAIRLPAANSTWPDIYGAGIHSNWSMESEGLKAN